MDPINFIPRVTGSISATASSLIIYLIFRSETKLSSIYHRIMFSMSCADILSSAAIALTTLPMPSEFPCEGNPWEGRAKGNIQTCEAQGFIIVAGGITGLYNAALCVYYACAIAFQMREENIHKRVEPFLHSIPMFFGLVVAIPPLFLDLYNPGPGWCTLRSIECTAKDDFDGDQYQYIRGSNVMVKVFDVLRFISLGVWLILIVGSFSLIIRRSWRIDQELLSRNQEATNGNDGNVITVQRFSSYRQTTVQNVTEDDSRQDVTTTSSRSDFSDIQRKNQTTKLIVKQALAYTVVLVFSILFPSILGFYRAFGDETSESYFIIHTLTAIFLPLQGFFNFVIFLWHKVHNYCRVNEEESYCSVIYRFFFKGEVNEPVMLSRISMVRDEHDNLRIELQGEHRRERYYDDNLQSIPGTTNSQTDNHLSVDSQSDIRLDSFSDNGLSGFTSGKQSEGLSYYSSKVDSNTSTIKN
mmetsp:Transcript_20118/g.24791  ORF Transcript_20118/g.24791 Transcript_20118/m.24791 type:complete len:470 (+) Transcript_20118:77-1486(+)